MTAPDKMPYAEKKRRAQAIYDAQIRHLIGPAEMEKFVKIDVLTGDYEIGDDSIAAGRKLRARRPEAVMHTIQGHRTRVLVVRSPLNFARPEVAAQ